MKKDPTNTSYRQKWRCKSYNLKRKHSTNFLTIKICDYKNINSHRTIIHGIYSIEDDEDDHQFVSNGSQRSKNLRRKCFEKADRVVRNPCERHKSLKGDRDWYWRLRVMHRYIVYVQLFLSSTLTSRAVRMHIVIQHVNGGVMRSDRIKTKSRDHFWYVICDISSQFNWILAGKKWKIWSINYRIKRSYWSSLLLKSQI